MTTEPTASDDLHGLVDDAHRILHLSEEIVRLRAELAEAKARYDRDVLGLNNEGDPIGGDPPHGLKQRAEAAERELVEVKAQRNASDAVIAWFMGRLASEEYLPVDMQKARDEAIARHRAAKGGAGMTLAREAVTKVVIIHFT